MDFDDDLGDLSDSELLNALSKAENSAKAPASVTSTSKPAYSGQTAPVKSASTAFPTQPIPQPLSRLPTSKILVNPNQKGNPLLSHLKIGYEYGPRTQLADYVLPSSSSSPSAVLYLSLKYHRLRPEYIFGRVNALGTGFSLRVLMVMLDIEAPEKYITDLSQLCFNAGITMIMANSAQNCARYIDDFKRLDGVGPKALMGREKKNYNEAVSEFCTVVRQVNKTDAITLLTEMGTVKAAVNAKEERLREISGWGEVKAKKWTRAVKEGFRPDVVVERQVGIEDEAEVVLAELEREEAAKKRRRENSSRGAAIEEHAGIMDALRGLRQKM